MAFALIVALASDAIQIPLQAVILAPEIIDVIAMVLTTLSIGFHLLLLPTFVIEFIPLVDMVPTWTGCVIAVLVLRSREPGGVVPPPTVTASPPPLPPQLQSSNPARPIQRPEPPR